MLKIGYIEDHETNYAHLKKVAKRCAYSCETIWFRDFNEFYAAPDIEQIDLLIVDRTIADDYGDEQDLFIDGHIENILKIFSGPLVLSSCSKIPNRYKHYFFSIIRHKTIKNLTPLLHSIFPPTTQTKCL